MASLAFELGFDWDTPPIIGVRDGVFPLQLALVDDDGGVVSPYDSSVLQAPGQLCFRIYDFTDPATYRDPSRPVPNVLQILFTSATSGGGPFSPVLDGSGTPRAQLAAMSFDKENTQASIAYNIGGSAVPGWTALWPLDESQPLQGSIALGQFGRFKFRALLTVGIPGQMVRFYRIDPEMVIGDAGGGP